MNWLKFINYIPILLLLFSRYLSVCLAQFSVSFFLRQQADRHISHTRTLWFIHSRARALWTLFTPFFFLALQWEIALYSIEIIVAKKKPPLSEWVFFKRFPFMPLVRLKKVPTTLCAVIHIAIIILYVDFNGMVLWLSLRFFQFLFLLVSLVSLNCIQLHWIPTKKKTHNYHKLNKATDVRMYWNCQSHLITRTNFYRALKRDE